MPRITPGFLPSSRNPSGGLDKDGHGSVTVKVTNTGAVARQLGVNGWYAPALNMHRTPFGARNYEYYSEDSLVSGIVATQTVKGALEAGAFVYAKHFICDDADSYFYRDSIYTWMTEQALREVYLAPFKMLIQEGGCTGLRRPSTRTTQPPIRAACMSPRRMKAGTSGSPPSSPLTWWWSPLRRRTSSSVPAGRRRQRADRSSRIDRLKQQAPG